jgi:hypothetical protein
MMMSRHDCFEILEPIWWGKRERLQPVHFKVATPDLTLNFLERLGSHRPNTSRSATGQADLACGTQHQRDGRFQ